MVWGWPTREKYRYIPCGVFWNKIMQTLISEVSVLCITFIHSWKMFKTLTLHLVNGQIMIRLYTSYHKFMIKWHLIRPHNLCTINNSGERNMTALVISFVTNPCIFFPIVSLFHVDWCWLMSRCGVSDWDAVCEATKPHTYSQTQTQTPSHINLRPELRRSPTTFHGMEYWPPLRPWIHTPWK